MREVFIRLLYYHIQCVWYRVGASSSACCTTVFLLPPYCLPPATLLLGEQGEEVGFT